MNILYEDEWFGAVCKPPKMLTHRTEISNGDTVFAVQEARELFGKRVWPVYRLDRGTSGVLLFAFSAEAASRASQYSNFRAGDTRLPARAGALSGHSSAGVVGKRYLALVRGWLPEAKVVDRPLARIEDSRIPRATPDVSLSRSSSQASFAVSSLGSFGACVGLQAARTYIEPLATGEIEMPDPMNSFPTVRLSLVSAELDTGRRHQIRRHLKHLAHPVIGDSNYGKGPLNRALSAYARQRFPLSEQEGSEVDRLMLHCFQICFVHPYLRGRPRILLESKPDGIFLRWIKKLSESDALQEVAGRPFHSFF